MNSRRFRSILLLLIPMLFLAILAQRPLAVAAPVSSASLTRGMDPVTLTGNQFPTWMGVALDQLFLYAYHQGNGWEQIPWQFDEKHDGVYVANEDGKLDADDELAFMARDCGDQAPASQWIGDVGAQNRQRYEIAVTDPLHADERCWVYLYRSATLGNHVARDYVNFDDGTAASDTYRLTLQPKQLIAADLKFFGSQVDVLDRTKVRAQKGSLILTEDGLVPDDPRTDWYDIRDGNVRTIAQFMGYDSDSGQSSVLLTLVNYRDMFQEHVTFDLSSLAQTLDEFRYSADLTSAMAGGTYYDANTPGGVPVDGSPDAVATTPFSPWNQVSHPTLGSIVQVIDPASLGGTQQTYYKDDASYDAADTGDHKSYADPGLLVLQGSANLDFFAWYYVLPAGQPNVGATYANAALHPLQAQAVAQERAEATPTPIFLYLPLFWE